MMGAMQQFTGQIALGTPPGMLVSLNQPLEEAWKVYLVRVLETRQWYPHPFARRELAHQWAKKMGHAEHEYEVQGFRVRE